MNYLFKLFVGCLVWLSMTPAQRRAALALAEQQERRGRLRVIRGGQDGA